MTDKELLIDARSLMATAIDGIENALIGVVRNHGGLILVPPTDAYDIKAVVYDSHGWDDTIREDTIYAVRYDDDYGLSFLTDNGIYDYEYDNDYKFESYYDLNEEDMEHLRKMTEVSIYFEYLHEGNTDFARMQTLLNIVNGLDLYL